MELLIKIFNFANTEVTPPVTFGTFHIVCILTAAFITIAMCIAFMNCSDRALRRICGSVWVILLIFEIYKQLIYGFSLSDGVFVWDYAWYIFPFQFCSSPLYILPFIAFAKNEKLRECCVAYMMTFSLFAGVAVFCYPNDVFTVTAGVNLQTMVHHGSQIIMGVFLGVRYRQKLNARFFLGGASVFVAMVMIAMALNVAAYHMFDIFGIDETFNMFFISPYFTCTLPLLSIIWDLIPYGAFVCVYFFGFILCALLVYGLFYALTHRSKNQWTSRSAKRQAYENDCVFYYNM